MSNDRPAGGVDRAGFIALAGELRPELHRYCARLTGSVIDGEDVVQDTLMKAFAALPTLEAAPPARAWLFRIAHNRSMDLLRSRAIRTVEPLEAAEETADPEASDPLDLVIRREATKTAVSRFVELPIAQRSVVVLKDVLGHSLQEIATMLDTTVDAVKAHLARGRRRLAAVDAREAPAIARAPSAEVTRYTELFNRRDWESLRALLAEDVKLHQSDRPMRIGVATVGEFFTFYARYEPVRVAPARLEGREVIAVFEDGDPAPGYFMWLEWRDGQISLIRDYRYVRYVMESAELTLAEGPAGMTLSRTLSP